MLSNPFVSIDTLVKGFSKTYGIDLKMLELRLKRDWHQIAGMPLALHTCPSSIRFRALSVLAENSAWLQQLVFLKPVLLEKINAFAKAPLITDIVLRVAEKPCFTESLPSNPLGSFSQPAEPHPETLAFAESVSGCLKNPVLQNSFTQLIAKALTAENLTV